MRLCLITTSYPRFEDDDAGIFIKRLVLAYTAQKATGIVIVPHDSNEERHGITGSFSIVRPRYGIFTKGELAFGAGIMPNLRRRPWLAYQIFTLILSLAWTAIRHRKDYDLVHANWIGAAAAAWLVKVIIGKPYILTLRGEDMRIMEKRFLRPFFTPVIKSAQYITSVNREFTLRIAEVFKVEAGKIKIIPNGVNIEAPQAAEFDTFIDTTKLSKDKQYLLFVGTLIPRKRVHLLLELISKPALSEYELILCGRGEESYLKYLKELAEKLAVRSRIHFIGATPPRLIPFYLKLTKFFISASEFEGRPNAALEAMAAGKVVFLSNIPAHQEIVSHGINGFIFSSIDEVPALIEGLKQNDSEKSIAIKAKQSVAQYSWENTAKSYLELMAG